MLNIRYHRCDAPDCLECGVRNVRCAWDDSNYAMAIADKIRSLLVACAALNVSDAIATAAIVQLARERGDNLADLAVPQFSALASTDVSNVRVRLMELGFEVWPSPTGWAPMDLPWCERRILIRIVEGIASLARLQERENGADSHSDATTDSGVGCGDPDCGSCS